MSASMLNWQRFAYFQSNMLLERPSKVPMRGKTHGRAAGSRNLCKASAVTMPQALCNSPRHESQSRSGSSSLQPGDNKA